MANLIYVCRSSEKIKEKKVVHYLEIVRTKFEREFQNKLLDWDGNIEKFNDIDKIINIKEDKEN